MSELLVSLWGTFLENFWYLIVFCYGAVVGSFLNVLIYRMPLGMSVSKPPSHCPRCNTLLRFWDNIPLIAFLSLGGRCRYCRVPISWRYFCVELLTACLWVALFFHVADRNILSWVDFLAQALFVSILIAVIFIDLDHFIIPDELNWFGIAFGVIRDIGCLALGWFAIGGALLPDAVDRFGFLGLPWLPRSIPGALLYGGAIYLVSYAGFVYYARAEGESFASVSRRFVTMEDYPEAESPAMATGESAESERGVVVTPATAENLADAELEEPEGEAVRLRFSPAFLALISALVLLPALKLWAVLFFLVPFGAFALLSRQAGESIMQAASRFFQADDQAVSEADAIAPAAPATAPVEEPILLPGDERLKSQPANPVAQQAERELTSDEMAAQLRAESDQFAIEAEDGKHGGMGLGDVKLALAIGAILGPGPALLSLFVATFVGAATGITLARVHGRSLRLAIPFGPFMAVGAIVVMLYGAQMMDWYLGTFWPKPEPLSLTMPG